MKLTVPASLDRIALAAVAAMASVPFLVPAHTSPITLFHSEWIAALLGLGGGLALAGARRFPAPGAALLALALAALVMVQAAFGRAPVPQLSTLFVLYLLWAAWVACLGAHLAATLGRERLVGVLAAALLAGAVLAAVLGALTPWVQLGGWPLFPIREGGTLGQANHLSVYLWLGLASALHLRLAGRLPAAGFWTVAGMLTLAAVLAGQRSSFVYAVALIATAAWRGCPAAGAPDGRRLALGVGMLFVAWQPVAAFLPQYDGLAKPPPALRALQGIEGPSVRLQLLRTAFAGIAAAPLLGNGVGSYPGMAIAHADAIAAEDNPGPSEHAHNLIADLGVELGLPAAALVVLAALYWLRRLPARTPPPEARWAAATVGMLALHSLIEYPLWHTYFLGLVALVAGTFGARRHVGGRLAAVTLTLGLLVWGSLSLLDLRRDYARLELALALGDASTKPLAAAALLGIPQRSLLTPWVQTTACVSLDPLKVPLADGLAVCRAAMAFAPTAESGTNLAILLWRSERTAEGHDVLRRLVLASRGHAREHGDLIKPFVARQPRVAELLDGRN